MTRIELFEEPGMGMGTVIEALADAGARISVDSARIWTAMELRLAYDWAHRVTRLRDDPASWDKVTAREKPSFVAAAEDRLRADEQRERERAAPGWQRPPGTPGGPLRISRALALLARIPATRGEPQRQWLLDQAARHLTGCVYEDVRNAGGWTIASRLADGSAYLAWRPEGWEEGEAP